MAEAGLSAESISVLDVVATPNHFLLSGGAGSGKTYSLVEITRAILLENPTATVACITYTNIAAMEITERINHDHLWVSTIHEFLWATIKSFQHELKTALIELINDEEQPRFSIPDQEAVPADFFDGLEQGIQYKEYVRLSDGIISHDELIVLSSKLYASYPKLCSITKDKYPYILIDEYQDTDSLVVEILLTHLNASNKPCVVGFIGDAMQAIYPDGVGDLNAFLGDGLVEVQKAQNRRNPQKVIELANRLRTDGLIQTASDDPAAPNIDAAAVKPGDIKFIYSDDDNLDPVRAHLGWDFSDSSRCKELNLTHNLIAAKAGFPDLMRIYDGDKILGFVRRIKKYIKANPDAVETEEKTLSEVVEALQAGKTGAPLNAVSPTASMRSYSDQYQTEYQLALQSPYEIISRLYIDKDQLLDDKKNNQDAASKVNSQRDDLIRHLFKIQHCLRLYTENRISEFIRLTDFAIRSVDDKSNLKTSVELLLNSGAITIGHAIDSADQLGIVKIDDRLNRFIENKAYIYQQVREVPYSQFRHVYSYLEGFTPFSTQHKTKGDEFENVLVIMDNGNWNNYNFEALFTGEGRDTVIERSQKIFYVCCTRAMENLAIFYHSPSPAVLARVREWFGEENTVQI